MARVFNQTLFKGKKTVYVSRRKEPGISDIYDWHTKHSTYVKREFGHRYYAIKRVPDGSGSRQVSKCFDSLDEARRWRHSDVSARDHADISTFGEILERFFAIQSSHLRFSTVQTYRNQAVQLVPLSPVPMNRLDEFTVDRWIQGLKHEKENMKSSRLSFEKEVGLLKQVCRFYVEYFDPSYRVPVLRRHVRDSIISAERINERKSRAKDRYMTDAQRASFLRALSYRCDRTADDRRVYVLAFLQVLTGLRIGEAASLRWNDVDLDRAVIKVSRTVIWSRRSGIETVIANTTKSGEAREVPMLDAVKSALTDLRERESRSLGLIFSSDGVMPLSYRAIQYRYDVAFKSAGIDFRSTHILRHSFATDFLGKTSHQSALQAILGHATSKQTAHYAKITAHLKQRAMDDYSKQLHSSEGFENVVSLGNAGKKSITETVVVVTNDGFERILRTET